MLRGHLTRTRLVAVLGVVAGVLIGAVVGQPGAGQAAGSNTKPKPKTLPTISGTAEIGITLVATRGTWSNGPTSFHFQWVRCDATGAACVPVGAATTKIYTVTTADQGHTLRVTVTAHNASGSASASSAATVVVPPGGCPPGTGAISIASLGPPARLDVSSATVTPTVKRSTDTIQLHFTVTACGGRPVGGAGVFATAIPYNQFSPAQGTTTGNGTVVLSATRRSGFPASRQQHLLAVFVRAWKQGEPVTGGVSSSRVVSFHFAHHH
jgi:hypothetical protein